MMYEIIFDAKLNEWFIMDEEGDQHGNAYCTKAEAMRDLKLLKQVK